jgi:hypothetical protein
LALAVKSVASLIFSLYASPVSAGLVGFDDFLDGLY